jgi:hypothetical protein
LIGHGGGLLGSISKFGQKRKDFFWGNGIYPSVTRFSLEPTDEIIAAIAKAIFGKFF